jgi:AraC-like DNA-binding protein
VSHFREEHQIEFYASKLYITTTYLSRIVREISSNTVNGFLSELLYNECCHLLKTTDRPIAEIAESLNFATQSSLGKFFKKYSGMSPFAYRSAQSHA